LLLDWTENYSNEYVFNSSLEVPRLLAQSRLVVEKFLLTGSVIIV
jgi:hypothetical protein